MTKNNLLSRDQFRSGVFTRDEYKCVICGEKAIIKDGLVLNLDAHHIIERRLFNEEKEFGGYYLDNGATLCQKHHIEAEQTTLSCEEIRFHAKINSIILPERYYKDVNYDKWGNIIIGQNKRLKGDLFYDESVQKILKQGNVLNEFVKYVKYPRTYHLPSSVLTKDDKMLESDSHFIGKKVVVLLKMDGENTTMYNDYIHARSIDSSSHETRNWVKGLWSQINYLIDDNMRICGENLYAVHSIKYNELPSYFMVFSIWIDNICLDWKETTEYCDILGLTYVPVIYEGIYNKEAIDKEFNKYKSEHEGYVVRLYDSFKYEQFHKSVAKYVQREFREKINNSHGHWISKKIEKNELKI